MTNDEMLERIEERVSEMIEDLARKQLASLMDEDQETLTKRIENSPAFKSAIYGYFERSIATTVGNRLRCGVYDGTQMDKLFDKIWTPELDRAIEDRIHDRVMKEIDRAVADRLRKLS